MSNEYRRSGIDVTKKTKDFIEIEEFDAPSLMKNFCKPPMIWPFKTKVSDMTFVQFYINRFSNIWILRFCIECKGGLQMYQDSSSSHSDNTKLNCTFFILQSFGVI